MYVSSKGRGGRQKSCEAYSWASLLSTGRTEVSNYIIWINFKKENVLGLPRATMAKFWKVLRWSFEALYRGTWPSHDHDGQVLHDAKAGQPLAGGYYGVLWALRGDLDYFQNTLNLEGTFPEIFFFCVYVKKFREHVAF